MMKLWFSTRNLPYNPNPHRPISSNTLHIRHNNSIFFSNSYLPRRKIWMIDPIYICKRSFNILHLPISTCRTRNILRILYFHRNMKHHCNPFICSNIHSIHRICSSMRTNVLLRSNSNYKLTISNPIHRNYPSRMNLRRVLSRQSYTNTFFSLFTLFFHSSLPP